MQSGTRTVIVTGTNKGIGYAIAERILQKAIPYDIIITARNQKLGQQAYDRLAEKYSSSVSTLTLCSLDISDSGSINSFVEWIKANRNSKFDVLINNAGFGYLRDTLEERLDTLKVNFFGTVELTEKLLPYLAEDGKIIMVSSENGLLSWQPAKMHKILDNPGLTKDKVMQIADELYEKTKTMTHTELGWAEPTYDNSKAILNAYTRWTLAKMLKGDQQCYSLDPGWCRTDMGTSSAPLSVEEGADTPIFLLDLPFKQDEKYNGKFFMRGKVHEY